MSLSFQELFTLWNSFFVLLLFWPLHNSQSMLQPSSGVQLYGRHLLEFWEVIILTVVQTIELILCSTLDWLKCCSQNNFPTIFRCTSVWKKSSIISSHYQFKSCSDYLTYSLFFVLAFFFHTTVNLFSNHLQVCNFMKDPFL